MPFGHSILSSPGGGGGGPVIPTSLPAWVAKDGTLYATFAALQAANPPTKYGGQLADPGSGIGRFLSAPYVGLGIKPGDLLEVLPDGGGFFGVGIVRAVSEVVAFNVVTGEVNIADPFDLSGQTCEVTSPTEATLLHSIDGGETFNDARVNFGGNVYNGTVTVDGLDTVTALSNGTINVGIFQKGNNGIVLQDLVVHAPDPFTSSYLTGILESVYVWAKNVVFNGFRNQCADFALDFDGCTNTGLPEGTGLADIVPWSFAFRDQDVTRVNVRLTFTGGRISGAIFEQTGGSNLGMVGTFVSIMIDSALNPTYAGNSASTQRLSIFNLKAGSTGTITPHSGSACVINLSNFGTLFGVIDHPDFPTQFSYFMLTEYSGTVTYDGSSNDFWNATVHGYSAAFVATEGAVDFSGTVTISNGIWTLDVGNGGLGFVASLASLDQSGAITITMSLMIAGAGGTIPSLNSICGYVVMRQPGGFINGGTLDIQGVTQFDGCAMSMFFGLNAGASLSFNITVSAFTFMDNITMNEAIVAVDFTYGAGVIILISGSLYANLGATNATGAYWVAVNHGQCDLNITSSEVFVSHFVSSDGGIAFSDSGGNLRFTGAIAIQDFTVVNGHTMILELAGVATVEVAGSIRWSHGVASGGGTWVMINVAIGATGVGPGTWRIDFTDFLMVLILVDPGGGGFVVWVGSAVRWRHVYFDFRPQVSGAIMAALEIYESTLFSGATLLGAATCYVLVGGVDPALFVMYKCNRFAKIPAGSFPTIMDSWQSIPWGVALAGVPGDIVQVGPAGTLIPAVPGSLGLGILFNAPALGDSGVVVTDGRITANAIAGTVPGPLIQGAAPPTSVAPGAAATMGWATTAVGVPVVGKCYMTVGNR